MPSAGSVLLLGELQHYYNWQRTHGSLKGKTPMEKVWALMDETSLSEEVYKNNDQSKERIEEANYQTDLTLRRLKAKTA